MDKKYVSIVKGRNPLPRNKRLRQEGASVSSVGGSMVTIGGSVGSADGGHTHENLADLNKISVEDGYVLVDQTGDDGPTTEKVKAGWADEAEHANEADHATNADEAKEAKHAVKADNATQWNGHEWSDWLDQPVRSVDAVKFDSVSSNDILSVMKFVDGLLGSGYRMWADEDGVTHLSVDKLTVRQTMTVLELLVEKMRSVGGALVVSAANGKIKSVDETDSYYRITFEQDNNFQRGDLIRCSTLSGSNIKSYWVEVLDASDAAAVVAKSSFSGVVPSVGDDCVLMGNTLYKDRQNLILISATEDGQPRIDVLNGVKSTSLDGCLRVRLGNLDGIHDDWFGEDNQPHGDGLYADNAYLKGTFLLETGEDVKTKFEVTEGKIESVADGIRQDFVNDKGYLSNASFTSGMDKWQTDNEAVFWLADGKWIWANYNVLSKQMSSAKVVTNNSRKVLRIRNKWIEQKNEQLLSKPEMTDLANGRKEAVPVYLSFFYRCSKAGKLTVGFESVDKTGFEEFESLHVEEDFEETSGYEQWTGYGMWNGTGDFRLSFTGEIYLYMLILTTDRVNALSYRYRTLFEQTENLVRICAAVYDKNAQALQETGLFVRPEGAGILTQDAEGNMAFIGTSVDEVDAEGHHHSRIKLGAENIQLEGLVTANENFKILEDGSIEAQNATLKGHLYTRCKQIEQSDAVLVGTGTDIIDEYELSEYLLNEQLTVDASIYGVVLPVSEKYEGAHVILIDSFFQRTRLPLPHMTIRTSDGSKIVSGYFSHNTESYGYTEYQADKVSCQGGSVEFVLLNKRTITDSGDTSVELVWVLTNCSCNNLYWENEHKKYQYKYNSLFIEWQ